MSTTDPSQSWGLWLDSNELGWLMPASENAAVRGSQWKPNESDAAAAWPFLIELRSRIATRTLAFRTGDEAAALNSIYQLFGIFRRVAKRNPGCVHFATLTLRLLDMYVRPFTAYWHKQSIDGRLESMDVRITFRLQLAQVRTHLERALPLFAFLCGVSRESMACDATQTGKAQQLPRLPLLPTARVPSLEPVFVSERATIRLRRAAQTIDRGDTSEQLYDGAGLALSGGGIRSATFGLGVVSVLAQRGVLRQVDYLSTVSGGGYLGAFVTSLLGQERNAPNEDQVFGKPTEPETTYLRVLRNHSRYLIEGGIDTIFTFAGIMLYGILASVLMVVPFVCLFAFAIDALQSHREAVGSVLPYAWAIVGLGGFVLIQLAQRLSRTDSGTPISPVWTGLLLVLFLMFIASRPWMEWARSITRVEWGVATIALVVALVAVLRAPSKHSKNLTGALVGFVGPCLLVVIGILADVAFADHLIVLFWTGLATVALTAFVNLNVASPHAYYRDRVARTFILTSLRNGIVEPASLKLSGINPSNCAPYQLVNAALNIPATSNPEIRGRRTDFFLFSRFFCGSPTTGFVSTKDWEAANQHLSFASAIAISGAAVAPNMGMNATSRFRQLLALLNVRLDYWLKKPNVKGALWPWCYFWHEVLGNMDEQLPFLNVSDGGHIENLGIYELLRRQCKFVIAVDGEADPLREFPSLVALTQLAYVDFGVRIEPDLANLRVDARGIGKSHFELFRIVYPGDEEGLLLYIKSSLTGNESEFLKRYQAEHPEFPHESTAQQLYSERQFEAYRSLGEHVANELFRDDLVGSDWVASQKTIEEWFARLSVHLLTAPH